MNDKPVTKPGNKRAKVAKASEASSPKEVIIKTSEAVTELISLDEYIKRHKPHVGLVASFRYEAAQDEKGLAERSEGDWEEAFEAQSKRIYPSFQ